MGLWGRSAKTVNVAGVDELTARPRIVAGLRAAIVLIDNRNGWLRKCKRIEEISNPRTATARQEALPGCQHRSNVLSNQDHQAFEDNVHVAARSRRVGVLPRGSARQTLVALMAPRAPRCIWW
jgi:hypothetical protein